jgi:hypothetical protein
MMPHELTDGEIQAVYGMLGVILSVVGSVMVARLSSRAQDRKTAADADLGAGSLALRIANRAERRVGRLEDWRREVAEEWWPAHDARDRAIEADLRKLDPAVVIPPSHRMPPYNPYVEPDQMDSK